MEQQPTAPDYIQAIFNEMEGKTRPEQQPWHDAMLELEDLNSSLKGKKIHQDLGAILGTLEAAMGKENLAILLEWAGIEVKEGIPTIKEETAFTKLDKFLNQETSRFSNAHPGDEEEQAA